MANATQETHALFGTILQINEAKSYGSNGFTKQTFVVRVKQGQYDNLFELTVSGDNVALLAGYAEGDVADFAYTVRGSRDVMQSDGSYRAYNSLDVNRIERGF
jgi:hypothetical protein